MLMGPRGLGGSEAVARLRGAVATPMYRRDRIQLPFPAHGLIQPPRDPLWWWSMMRVRLPNASH